MKILLKLKNDNEIKKIDGVSAFRTDEKNNLHISFLYNDVGSIYNKNVWSWVKEEYDN